MTVRFHTSGRHPGRTPRPQGRCANCETDHGPFVGLVDFPPLRICKPTKRLIPNGQVEVEDPETGEITIQPRMMVALAAPECRKRRDALDKARYEPALR